MHKWTLLILFCAACVLGAVALILAIPEQSAHDGEAAQEPVVEDIPLNVAAAEEVYSNNCLSCHGDQLQGAFGPELATVGSRLSQEELADIILNGQGSMMPAFKDGLSKEEIVNLAKWLSEHK
jgi:cytochrome c550